MQRALAPFRRGGDEPAPGPYYNMEKSGPAMTGETLVGISAMRAQGPNSPAPGWVPPSRINNNTSTTNGHDDDTRYLGPSPAHRLTVQTSNLAPAAGAVSPVSQVSLDPPTSEVSPISPSFNHSGTLPIQDPSPPSVVTVPGPLGAGARSGATAGTATAARGGTAISIAGSEARIVRIPPRSSRLASSSASGANEGSLPPAPPPPQQQHHQQQQRFSSGSTELRPPPLAVNRANRKPPVSMRRVPVPAPAPAMASGTPAWDISYAGNNGGYQAYHPSLGRNPQQGVAGGGGGGDGDGGGGGPSRLSLGSSRISQRGVSGASVASSDVFSPGSITWPMPPRSPTTSPDPH